MTWILMILELWFCVTALQVIQHKLNMLQVQLLIFERLPLLRFVKKDLDVDSSV